MAGGIGLWFDTYPAVLLVERLRSGRYLVQFSWSYNTAFDEKESAEVELGSYKTALAAVTHAMAAAKMSAQEIRQLFEHRPMARRPWPFFSVGAPAVGASSATAAGSAGLATACNCAQMSSSNWFGSNSAGRPRRSDHCALVPAGDHCGQEFRQNGSSRLRFSQ